MGKEIILLFALLILQASFLPHFLTDSPNLLLIAVFIYSLFSPSFIIPYLGGILADIFSENPFGIFTIASFSIFFIARLLKRYV